MVLVSLREQGLSRGNSNAAKSQRWAGVVPRAGGHEREQTCGGDAGKIRLWWGEGGESCVINMR